MSEIQTLINKYNNFLKYHNECAHIKNAKVFDITETDGWEMKINSFMKYRLNQQEKLVM